MTEGATRPAPYTLPRGHHKTRPKMPIDPPYNAAAASPARHVAPRAPRGLAGLKMARPFAARLAPRIAKAPPVRAGLAVKHGGGASH